MKIALIQSDLFWADPEANMFHFESMFEQLQEDEQMVVLPEAFSSGFVMDKDMIEEISTFPVKETMIKWTKRYGKIFVGSAFVNDQGKFFNRMFWVEPNGKTYQYDKRHLFSYAGENKIFTPGKQRISIQSENFIFRLNICYDLRFPVWNANTLKDNQPEYDVLLYVANWPEKRRTAYLKLLQARAIENQSYVIWVNRVGEDGYGNHHTGDTCLIGPDGSFIDKAPVSKEQVLHIKIRKPYLDDFRTQFPFYKDWDKFSIET